MSATVLLALTTSLLGSPAANSALAARPADPPVRIWLNPSYGFERGDRVRLDARAEADGYLLVLHADPSGRIRVLFPLDPFDDSFVRGGRKFELRGRGDRAAFTVYESNGVGTVLAAWSADPFSFADFVRGDHWDYTLASTWDSGDDAETYLVGLVQRVVASSQFDYDVAQYDVGAYAASGRSARHYRLGFYHDYYDRFGFTVGWGSPYGYSSWYRPYNWYGYDYYDPFSYSGWYDPWYGPYYPYGAYCLGWCSWRTYYYSNYWRYPRAVAYNNYYYDRSPGLRYGAGAYTFKLNGQPRFVAQPRQRAPLATALGRRLSAEPVGVVTGRRTDLAESGRRVLADRTVRPAIGGGTAQRGIDQPRRVDIRDAATVTGRTPDRVQPGRVTTKDRAVVPADQTRPEPRRVNPRDRSVTTERVPEREAQPRAEPRRVEREPVERPRAESERPQARERPPARQAEPQRRPEAQERPRVEARPRLEPRREPTRSAPERSAQPSRGSGPSVRSAPPRSSGSSGRSAGPSAAPRSSPPARSGGSSSSGGGRRRG